MRQTKLIIAALLLSPMAAHATPIVSDAGLIAPDAIVDFETIVLAPGTVLTDQYAAEGVTFSNVSYDTQSCAGFPGFGGDHCAGNNVDFGNPLNPFSIMFTDVVSAAALGFATNSAITTVSAYLGATLIEQFEQATSFDNPATAYLGFSNILFDRIEFSVTGDGQAVFDNIQYNVAAVPEPGTLALLGIGLLGMGAARFRKKA